MKTTLHNLEQLAKERVQNRNFIDRDIEVQHDDVFFGTLQLTTDYAIDIDGNEMVYTWCGDFVAKVSEDLSLKILDMLWQEEAEEKESEESYRDKIATENYLMTASRNW